MKARRFIGRTALHLVLFAFAAVWLIPTLGLLATSFRTPEAIFESGWWTVFAELYDPESLTLANYRQVIQEQGMGRAFGNSLLISVPATLSSTLIAALAAYGFAWMKFRGRNFLYAMLIGLMVVPLQITFIPILPVYRRLGLSGTFPGIWLAHVAYGLPLAVYLLHNFISGIPPELFDSAAIDGASAFKTFIRIVLPVSASAIASVAIFQFLWIWNDLLVALIYLGATPDVVPITLKMANLVTNRGQNWELLTAAAFVAIALPLSVFFLLQRFFVRGILAGSIKG